MNRETIRPKEGDPALEEFTSKYLLLRAMIINEVHDTLPPSVIGDISDEQWDKLSGKAVV